LFYNNSVIKNVYKHTKTTVSLINYHFVFCPKYRRKIFNIPGVEDRFKELTISECEKNNIEILAMECHVDHVHLFVSVYPQMSIPDVMKVVKGATSRKLRDEFPKLKGMSSLWTRSYFVSTAGKVSSETIKWYVETQKTRG
jgi:putative transposase